MQSTLLRVLIAVIVVVVLFAVIGPLMNILELPHGGDIVKIIKLVIGGLALLYIIGGTNVSGWFKQA